MRDASTALFAGDGSSARDTQLNATDLLEQLRLARQEGLDLTQTESQIAILDAEIKEERRIYELITSRIKEIDLNQETLINNIRILEEASLPGSPVRPNKPLGLAGGILLGLFLGLGTVFFLEP